MISDGRGAERRALGLVVLLTLSVIALATPVAGSSTAGRSAPGAPATAATTTVDACTVINQSGRYVLTQNVSRDGTCIRITASDVVLDGQGHTVAGADTKTRKFGILVDSTGERLANVTVTDVRLEGWRWNGFGNKSSAIVLERVNRSAIAGVTVSGGDQGIHLADATNVTVWGTEVRKTKNQAIKLDSNSRLNRLVDNRVQNPDGTGIHLQNSRNNTFRDNRVSRAGSGHTTHGIRVAQGSSWNWFVNNTVSNSCFDCHGIAVGFSDHLTLRDNVVTESGRAGIHISHGGTGTVLRNNTANGNQWAGISVGRTQNTTIAENTASRNGGHGINVRRSSNATVTRSEVTGNENYGVQLRATTRSTLTRTNVSGNQQGGIRLQGGENNSVRYNVVLNHTRGIDIVSSNYNTLSKNLVRSTSRYALRVDDSKLATVESLDIGHSTAPNTEVSLEAENVTIGSVETAPQNPDATGIDRYLRVRRTTADPFLNVSIHYESRVSNASRLALWRHDGTSWTRLNSLVYTGPRRVAAVGMGGSNATIGAFVGDEGGTVVTPTPAPTAAQTATTAATGNGTAAGATGTPTAPPAGNGTATPGGATPTPTSGGTSGDGAGFGAVIAVIALLCSGALLAHRED